MREVPKGRTIRKVMGGGDGPFSACTNFFSNFFAVFVIFFLIIPCSNLFFFSKSVVSLVKV
jgi:hypothetical protein